MTLVGKLFVLFNLVLSLMMATVAFGLYATGIDWSNNKAKAGQPGGKLSDVEEEIKQLQQALYVAESGYRSNRIPVFKREDTRRSDHEWYAAQLRFLNSTDLDVKQVVVAKGLITLDKDGKPVLMQAPERPGDDGSPNLRGRRHFERELNDLWNKHKILQGNLSEKVVEDTQLTNVLIGDETNTKGLRHRLADERVKRLGVMDELGITEGLKENIRIESDLSLNRVQELDDRIQELVRYLKRRHNVDEPTKWR